MVTRYREAQDNPFLQKEKGTGREKKLRGVKDFNPSERGYGLGSGTARDLDSQLRKKDKC